MSNEEIVKYNNILIDNTSFNKINDEPNDDIFTIKKYIKDLSSSEKIIEINKFIELMKFFIEKGKVFEEYKESEKTLIDLKNYLTEIRKEKIKKLLKEE